MGILEDIVLDLKNAIKNVTNSATGVDSKMSFLVLKDAFNNDEQKCACFREKELER